MQDPAQHLGQQEVVAVDPLEVRAVGDGVPGPPELQEGQAVDVVLAGGDVQPGTRVVDGSRDANVDAADIIDHLHDAGEFHLDEVIEMDPGDLLDRFPQARRAAVGERLVDLHDRRGVVDLARQAAGGRAAILRDHRVPRDVQHGRLMAARRDVDDHDGVGAAAALRADVQHELLMPAQPDAAVGAEDQDVQRVVVLGRPVAEAGDRIVVDTVPDLPVLDVTDQRPGDQDHHEDRPRPRQRPRRPSTAADGRRAQAAVR